MILLYLLFAFVPVLRASPFQLTDQYVQDFKDGIAALKTSARSYTPPVLHYDPKTHNETEALTGTYYDLDLPNTTPKQFQMHQTMTLL